VRVINDAGSRSADRLGHLSAYLGCLSADDANDEAVKADEAWISTLGCRKHASCMASLRSALGGAE